MGEVACRRGYSRQLKSGRVRLLAAVFCYQILTSECKSSNFRLSSSKHNSGVIIIGVVVIIMKPHESRCKRNLFFCESHYITDLSAAEHLACWYCSQARRRLNVPPFVFCITRMACIFEFSSVVFRKPIA